MLDHRVPLVEAGDSHARRAEVGVCRHDPLGLCPRIHEKQQQRAGVVGVRPRRQDLPLGVELRHPLAVRGSGFDAGRVVMQDKSQCKHDADDVRCLDGPMIGFLHTSPAHVETFERLAGDTPFMVDESLLEDHEAGEDVTLRVGEAIDRLSSAGATVVVCTCSTLGPIAEQVDAEVPVVRIDQPMAEAAVAAGSRIGVIAALDSAAFSTHELLAKAGADLTLVTIQLVADAWELFLDGDTQGYDEAVASAARELRPSVDVVILAQASMVSAAELLDFEVLTSPASAVAAAQRLLR